MVPPRPSRGGCHVLGPPPGSSGPGGRPCAREHGAMASVPFGRPGAERTPSFHGRRWKGAVAPVAIGRIPRRWALRAGPGALRPAVRVERGELVTLAVRPVRAAPAPFARPDDELRRGATFVHVHRCRRREGERHGDDVPARPGHLRDRPRPSRPRGGGAELGIEVSDDIDDQALLERIGVELGAVPEDASRRRPTRPRTRPNEPPTRRRTRPRTPPTTRRTTPRTRPTRPPTRPRTAGDAQDQADDTAGDAQDEAEDTADDALTRPSRPPTRPRTRPRTPPTKPRTRPRTPPTAQDQAEDTAETPRTRPTTPPRHHGRGEQTTDEDTPPTTTDRSPVREAGEYRFEDDPREGVEPILDLELGPVALDVLGVEIHLRRVHAVLTANPDSRRNVIGKILAQLSRAAHASHGGDDETDAADQDPGRRRRRRSSGGLLSKLTSPVRSIASRVKETVTPGS
jgi:hypothetical protein